jgi:hypothetical protein
VTAQLQEFDCDLIEDTKRRCPENFKIPVLHARKLKSTMCTKAALSLLPTLKFNATFFFKYFEVSNGNVLKA